MTMLEVRKASASYGKHRALYGVDLAVARGELVALLGANGAGKSTLLKVVSGLVDPDPSTQVLLDGQPLHTLPAHERVEAGLALVPEGRGIFADLSVRENLQLGAYARRARAMQERNLERVLVLFPRLKERLRQVVRTMSGGEQQMVAIGRALMAAPRVLLLDEPSIGLSPLLCTELFKAIGDVRDGEVGILLVEQNARRSLAIADRAYLLESGRITGTGTAQALIADPAIQRAYLGVA
jgi:ABC-type branched-subunit amino acid transport system ATPase component